ncbi:hypothetical protein [Streptomyces cylindrosporus]|uniref:Transposase (putative) YhgA-like domain-containing protein n=1 Tax=Streptomyces cylindrosporus TaxID=2927583 RepID=A0ABS9YMU2_9ACTN|nr:hypothetical protein [Streptomyces cylindrosporus]MCI3278568.1 hypothetical protein [Streptomyces cylindrosporus]
MAVSPHHESLHQVFQQDTELLVTAMQRLLGLSVGPVIAITPLDTTVTELLPMERRVDSLFRLDTEDRRYVVALESQGKPDPDKRRSWPYYLGYLGVRYEADAVLIVLTDDPATERWASQPVASGFPGRPSLIAQPLVLGPAGVPVISDAATAAGDISLWVLSCLVHGRDPAHAGILTGLAQALNETNPDEAVVYAEYVEAGLTGSPAVEIWRQLMSTMEIFFRSEAAQKVREEGREEGREEERARTVIMLLERRGLEVSDQVREHVLSCRDYEQLGIWVDRAWEVNDAQDLITATGQEFPPSPVQGASSR